MLDTATVRADALPQRPGSIDPREAQLRRLPIRVRPARWETPEGFKDRVREANGIVRGAWNSAERAFCSTEPERSSHQWIERVGGLLDGHFERQRQALPKHEDGQTCRMCLTGLSERFACVKCTRGVLIAQLPHDGPRVCGRHGLWIGPGTTSPQPAGRRAVRADRQYQALRRRGLLDCHRLRELEETVGAWLTGEELDDSAQRIFADAVGIGVIFASLDQLGPESSTPEDKYEELWSGVTGLFPGDRNSALVDRLWLLLRPVSRGISTPHSFATADYDSEDGTSRWTLGVLRTSAWPRGVQRHLSQFVSTKSGSTRGDVLTLPHARVEYLCHRGHPFTSTPARLSTDKTGDGCPYCGHRLPLVGFNTLADTHPDVLEEWDYARNAPLTPQDVLAGSGTEVWWLCEAGHSYPASPATKLKQGSRCGVCSNRRPDSEVNALSRTHPQLAREWHPDRNGPVTPDHVVSGSRFKAFWTCPRGHDYDCTVISRAAGVGCPDCGRRRAHPSTSLAATHPSTARLWHPSLNGTLTPYDFLAGSSERVWWQCDRGHEFPGVIYNRVRTKSCPGCREESQRERRR